MTEYKTSPTTEITDFSFHFEKVIKLILIISLV